MIQAVIFDLDGTIVDSNEAHVLAWDRAFRHFGKKFPMDQLRKHIGKGADQYLPEFLSPEELRTIGKKIERCHSEVFKEEYLPQVRPFPKVRELFERIKRDGKRIALATSGKKEELRIYKKIAQIEDLTDSEITADDAGKSKPEQSRFFAADSVRENFEEPGRSRFTGNWPTCWSITRARRSRCRKSQPSPWSPLSDTCGSRRLKNLKARSIR
jgi:beta-phosphoglucomutase-like phosphatase (HAD superfamily)